MKLNKITAASLLCLSSLGAISHADTLASYNNFYITYMSPQDVQSAVTYAESVGVSRFFMWTVDQDAPASSANSLIGAINSAAEDAQQNAQVVTYFPNYAVYNNQRAIPGVSYTITGSASDLDPKLQASNEFIYAFLETQVPTAPGATDDYINTPNSYGSVYMFDPWSDMAAEDPFCGKSGLPSGVPVDANGYNLICAYAFDNQGKAYDNGTNFNNYGNFEAFAALPNTINGKDGQPIQTSISIGGYGHNATYEAIFDPSLYGVTTVTQQQAITNFVNSVVILMNNYKINGVDLDYEDVAMTPAQSQQYLVLVKALNDALKPLNKFITIAVISNPEYIAGTENSGNVGFAEGVLGQIASLSQVKAIDLMTYDFSGTFNYGGPSNPGTTGFLSNVYPPADANTPAGYNFSIQSAVQALVAAGVSANKIGVGIPAYGRALASLPGPAGDGSYLFSPLNSSVVIPAGDQDAVNCTQDINTWQNSDSCQGMFSYNYIVNNIVGNGVVATNHQDDSGNVYNGTTAFGAIWNVPQAPSYSLTINNNSASSGQVAVGSWATNGYLATGSYSSNPTGNQQPFPANTPDLSSIMGQSGLPITFTYWDGTVSCGVASLTANLTVSINDSNPVTCSASN